MSKDGCVRMTEGFSCLDDTAAVYPCDSLRSVWECSDTSPDDSATMTVSLAIDGYEVPYEAADLWEETAYVRYPTYYTDARFLKAGFMKHDARKDFGVLDAVQYATTAGTGGPLAGSVYTPEHYRLPKTAGVGGPLVILMIMAIALVWMLFLRGASRRFTRLRRDGQWAETDIDHRRAGELARLVETRPDDPASRPAAMELGKRYYESGDFERAITWYERAIKMAPSAKNPEAHFHMGHALRYTNYLCDAIDEWMACYMEDPDGELGREAYREAQRWRAYQIVRDKEECPQCGEDCRLTDLECLRCRAKLTRTLVSCGVCGKAMVKEAQVCLHCLPDNVKLEVALGMDWPVIKTTMLDWEAQLIRSRLDASGILSVLTGEKGSAIPLTVGYLGEIHIRVPAEQAAEARAAIGA